MNPGVGSSVFVFVFCTILRSGRCENRSRDSIKVHRAANTAHGKEFLCFFAVHPTHGFRARILEQRLETVVVVN